MKITDALLGEHGVFYSQFDHLERVVPRTENLAELQAEIALVAAALEPHADLEDELLFDALEPHVGAMGPLAVMRQEHEEVKQTLSKLPTVTNLDEARDMALHAVHVARQHFAKEEQILFPLAQKVLGTESLTRIAGEWAERRRVTIPLGQEV